MFPWLHRHMIDLSHIDVSIIDGWGTSHFNRQDDGKWARRERVFLKDRRTIRRLKLEAVWRGCQQTQATCMKESKTKSHTPAVSCWIWHSTELTLSMTLAWSLALVSVLSFMYGGISNGLNQQVKRETKVWNQDIFMPVDNSCSHPLALKIIFWMSVFGQIGILGLMWNFHSQWLEQIVKRVVWPYWIMLFMLQLVLSHVEGSRCLR